MKKAIKRTEVFCPALKRMLLLSLSLLVTASLQAAKPARPAAPSNLSASSLSASQVRLTWQDNSSNESGFVIQRAPSSSGPWYQVGMAGANTVSFLNSGLSAGTPYYYRVRAYNSRGSSSYSSIASATTLAGSCTYSISPPSGSFAASGGGGSVSVTTGSGCGWTANSGAAWITITSGSSGNGSGSVSYSVAANTSTASRTGYLTVAGQTFTVNQAGASCSYLLSSTSASFTASGGSGNVNVTAGSGCGWIATSSDSWIGINSGSVGSGNGSVSYTVAANTGSARSGTLNIAGQTFTVNQTGTAVIGGSWVRRYGGTATDYGTAVAVAGNGDVVVVGVFGGVVDFGGGVLISAGGTDLFLARYSATGTHIWSRRFGGTGSEVATCISLDASGNIFVGGYFLGAGNLGGANLTSAGQQDAFLAKYSPEGGHLWSQRIGSTEVDVANGIAVDSQGNVIMTGFYQGLVPLFSPWVSYGVDTFLTKFSPAGAKVWARVFDTTGSFDNGNGVAVDRNDNIFITGHFMGRLNFGGGNLDASGLYYGYVVKLTPEGTYNSSSSWSRKVGLNNTWSRTVAVDSNGDVVISGQFQGQTDLGGGTVNGTAPSSGRDVFLSKYSGMDGSYRWARFILGSDSAQASSVASDAQNNIFLAGSFQGTYNFGGQSLSTINNSTANGFLCRYSSAGALGRVDSFGGTGSAGLYSIAADTAGAAVVTGGFSGTTSFAGQSVTSAGSYDVVLSRLAP